MKWIKFSDALPVSKGDNIVFRDDRKVKRIMWVDDKTRFKPSSYNYEWLDESPDQSPTVVGKEEIFKELACDFFWECRLDVTKHPYTEVRKMYDNWLQGSEYHKNKFLDEPSLSVPEGQMKETLEKLFLSMEFPKVDHFRLEWCELLAQSVIKILAAASPVGGDGEAVDEGSWPKHIRNVFAMFDSRMDKYYKEGKIENIYKLWKGLSGQDFSIHTSIHHLTVDAVEFMEWSSNNGYTRSYPEDVEEMIWYPLGYNLAVEKKSVTTAELYQLFIKSKTV